MILGINKLAKEKNNRKIPILGDMFELGALQKKLHKKIGHLLKD